MQRSRVADLAPRHNQPALPGSLGDFISRAEGRPIYCTASFAVRRALMNVVLGSLRRDFPGVVFVNALTVYRDQNDWSRRWYSEHERYGAGILVTRAEDLPEGTDPFAGLAGEHIVGSRVAIEIQTLVWPGRPVAWHAVVFPANYWISRFAIEPFNRIDTIRYARVLPASEVDAFDPIVL